MAVTVVVAGDGAMGGFVFIVAIGADEDTGHHGQGAEGGGDHIAHDVAIVIFARPDKASLGADDAGNGIVNEGIKVGDAGFFKVLFVVVVINFLENQFEGLVVLFGDGIFGGEP